MTQSSSNSIVKIQNEVKEANPSRKPYMYMVPPYIEDLNKDAYKPKVVSFGPYHHGEDHLAKMEKRKKEVLKKFLERPNKPPLDAFLKPLKEALPDLMGSYERLDDLWKENGCRRFLDLMMTDGCFMLEIMRFGWTREYYYYAENDPIFSHHGRRYTFPYIKRDMMMVENQIPLLVLEKILSVESENRQHVNALMIKFFSPFRWEITMVNVGLQALHSLDLYREYLVRPLPTTKKTFGLIILDMLETFRSATELDDVGVEMKVSHTSSLKDITFENGVLRLPAIVVDGTTESMFLNLMAFERLHVGTDNEINLYVFFMAKLIISARDVKLLRSKKIIQNPRGSDNAVAELFSSLSKDVTLDPGNELDEVWWELNIYCSKRRNTWRADLLRTYFRSPWAFMSLAAAVLLLCLTVTQTVYTILQYYKG